MRKIEYKDDSIDFIKKYNNQDHDIWNETQGPIANIRSEIRTHYLKEQSYCCAYCKIQKKETHGLTWDVEHILPKSKFPEFLFEPENLAVVCKECNTPKADTNILKDQLKHPKKFPNNSNEYTIIHPHFDKYDDHIEIAIIGNKRIYRIKNEGKAKQTYIICNLFRFDFKFGEWDSFDEAIANDVSRFIDNCPKNSNINDLKNMIGHLKFTEKHT